MVMFPVYLKEVYLNNIMKAKLYLTCPFSLHFYYLFTFIFCHSCSMSHI